MKKSTSSTEGSMIIVAAIITFVIMTSVALAFTYSMYANRDAQRTMAMEGAQAVGDAYMDWAFGYWRATCKGQTNMALPTSSFSGLTAPSSSLLLSPANFTASNYAIIAVTPELQTEPTPSGSQTYQTVAIAGQTESTGDAAYFYLATVDLSVPTIENTVSVKVRRLFEKQLSSPWQYAIFYTDMLEFHPSPVFSVNGWVHTNGQLFPSPDGGNSLTFQDKVDYTQFYYDGYSHWDAIGRGKTLDTFTQPDGTYAAAGAANTFAAGLTPAQAVAQDPVGIAPNQFSTTNPNDTSYREIIEAPNTAYPDTFTTDSDTNPSNPRYYNQAGLRITIDASNNISVLGAGETTPTTSSNYSKASAADQAMYTNTVAAITTNQVIEDFREAAEVRLTTIDVSALNPTKIGATWNNVIWISDQSVGTAVSVGSVSNVKARGIRVKNGATIPSGGISLVTDNPMYVQGDFNTGTWQPSLIAGDSINVLSNAWSDANSSASSPPTATATTVNSAFLTGNVPTANIDGTENNYSGGVENFPRFHENWSGVNFTYNGSMVEMFQSQQATGRWKAANYDPPNRIWAFDNRFRSTPPPGTLLTTTYIKGAWYLK